MLAVLGAHGGAGASTVAALLDPDERGAARELVFGEPLPVGAMPVLVARSTAYGLSQAAQALAGWHPSVPKPWLVLVADAPAPVPAPVRYRTKALGAQIHGYVSVPWLWPLRAADTPREVREARAVTRASARLCAAFRVDGRE